MSHWNGSKGCHTKHTMMIQSVMLQGHDGCHIGMDLKADNVAKMIQATTDMMGVIMGRI